MGYPVVFCERAEGAGFEPARDGARRDFRLSAGYLAHSVTPP